MFTSDMVDAQYSTVKINDFDPGIVKWMLEFMYTGKTDCLAEKAEELFAIEEKYC